MSPQWNGANANLANGNISAPIRDTAADPAGKNTTNGNYNGFQTGLRLQNKWGLSGEIDYTYSHEIDLTSSDLTGVSNPFNVKYDKASGNLDRRQMRQRQLRLQPALLRQEQRAGAVGTGWMGDRGNLYR